MNILNTASVLLTLSAIFSYLNYRFIKLPTTIGIMLIALLMSFFIMISGKLGFFTVQRELSELIKGIDFHTALINGMLSFLLFAGALHINLNDLRKQKWVVLILATLGVVSSTFIIGGVSWLILQALELNVSLIYCLLFGALISPTDPIAVMGILKTVGIPKSLEVKISGESLFNDGVAVVVFLVLLGIASGQNEVTLSSVGMLFLQEAIGGAIYGFVIGGICFYMLRSVNNYQVEILLTLALVMGGYALATAIHVSGPIAMVVAGLLIGNHGRLFAMSDSTRAHLDTFWELIDEVLNAVLFLLMGMEILILVYHTEYFLAALAIIPVVLVARFIAVGVPVKMMRKVRNFSPGVVRLMTWGGLRGGISVALALSLPQGSEREVILAITYAVVVFSILVQGLTLASLAKDVQAEALQQMVREHAFDSQDIVK
ncbi:MAG: sodium:proton antiporter [Gammaproteobacteria bacterium]|nr:sodium:proton antiporter [Gammaproteobacteria bacterium]